MINWETKGVEKYQREQDARHKKDVEKATGKEREVIMGQQA